MHLIEPDFRKIPAITKRVTAPRGAKKLASLEDVSPMKAAGVGNSEQHLCMSGERSQ